MSTSTAEAGPLSEKVAQLVRLAMAIGSGQEGAVHSHTRRALEAGATPSWRDDNLVDVHDPERDSPQQERIGDLDQLLILTAYGFICFVIGSRLFSYGRSQRS